MIVDYVFSWTGQVLWWRVGKLGARLDGRGDVCKCGWLGDGSRIVYGREGSSGLYEGRRGIVRAEERGIVLMQIYSTPRLVILQLGWVLGGLCVERI